MSKKQRKLGITQEQFLQKCKNRHGSKYDYSLVNYSGTKHNIIILCPIHGKFLQKAAYHVRGNGCPSCKIDKSKLLNTSSLEHVLTKFKNTHGNKYDYSNIKYTRINIPVEIICKIHGSFFQQPNDHIHGTGCPICSKQNQTLTQQQFIERSNKLFNNKFNYSEVNFINTYTKITIMCPTHGKFNQLPSNHLNGHGCTKCAYEQKHLIYYTEYQNIFIQRCIELHNNKYTYPNLQYKGVNQIIDILCPIHGTFSQKATNHLYSKQGCPKCTVGGRYSFKWFKEDVSRQQILGHLYIIKLTNNIETFYKIGITKRTILARWRSCKNYKIDIILDFKNTLYNVFLIEQSILNDLIYRNRYTPMIPIGGDCECFKEDKILLQNVLSSVEKISSLIPKSL